MAHEPATSLSYRFGSLNPHDEFGSARPWQGELGPWRAVLDRGRLEAASDERFASQSAARSSLETHLRAWEAVAFLRDQHEIFFAPGGVDSPAAGGFYERRERIFRRANTVYPEPDPSFSRTALVDRLLDVIRSFFAGSIALPVAVDELLAALGASLAEGESGHSAIAASFNIEPAVVEKLAELAGRARSSHAGEPAYRGPEWQWMQEALRRVTLQAGRRTDRPPADALRMADFREAP